MDQLEHDIAERTFDYGFKIDDRGIRTGVGRNHDEANIGGINPALVDNDANYYIGMRMAGPETDPIRSSNTGSLKDAIRKNLTAAFAQNSATTLVGASAKDDVEDTEAEDSPIDTSVNTASPEIADDVSVPSTPKEMMTLVMTFPRRCKEVAQGTIGDLQRWDKLPCRSHAEKTKYLMQQDNRIYYILALLFFIVIIIAGVRALSNAGRKP